MGTGERLAGKVALVTGAARGTGEAIARLFASEGAAVVLADVRDEAGEAVAKELSAAPGLSARYRHLDVTSEAEWREVERELREREGRLDVLVNNAAVLFLQPIDETSAEDFERVLRVNAVGPFIGTRACLPLLRDAAAERGDAAIVNVGSIDSVSGVATTSAYTASKFALNGLTRVTAIENGKFGVRANCLCPGGGSAEMAAEQFGGPDVRLPGRVRDESPAYDPAHGPLGRRGWPEELAPAALFLASGDSSFMTGAELLVDGGKRAGEYVDVPGRFSIRPPS